MTERLSLQPKAPSEVDWTDCAKEYLVRFSNGEWDIVYFNRSVAWKGHRRKGIDGVWDRHAGSMLRKDWDRLSVVYELPAYTIKETNHEQSTDRPDVRR